MKIRGFEENDFSRLVKLASAMKAESPQYQDQPIMQDKLIALGYNCLRNPEKWCGLVAENEGEIEGFFIGFCSENYFNQDKISSDLALFVPQTKRGGVIAIQLIKLFQDWSKENGAKTCQLGVTTGINQDRTRQLYNKLGFQDAGFICRKRL